jgi:hypothetical protein
VGADRALTNLAEKVFRDMLNFRSLGVATDLIEINTDGERPHIGRLSSAKNPEMLIIDLRLDSRSDGFHEIVAVVLDVEAQHIISEKPVEKFLALKQNAEYLAVRPGNVAKLIVFCWW